ncbi:MAG: hypothetical protein QM690_03835 [Sphingobium sp.]
MRRTLDRAAVLLLTAIGFSLSACRDPKPAGQEGRAALDSANAETANALEALAAESGVISQSSDQDPLGSYGRNYDGGEDRLCIASAGGQGSTYRAGIEIHIGDEEYCRGTGTVRQAGDLLIFTLGAGRCTIAAHYDGDQIVMPGAVDRACAGLCSARGSLAGVTFPRAASGAKAARAVAGRDGKSLCDS